MNAGLAATVLVLLGTTACGGGEPVARSTAAVPQPIDVNIASFAFTPSNLNVRAGEQLRFANGDAQPHTATSDSPGVFDTSAIAPARMSTPFTIEQPGTYAYHCSYHPFMKATVTVQ